MRCVIPCHYVVCGLDTPCLQALLLVTHFPSYVDFSLIGAAVTRTLKLFMYWQTERSTCICVINIFMCYSTLYNYKILTRQCNIYTKRGWERKSRKTIASCHFIIKTLSYFFYFGATLSILFVKLEVTYIVYECIILGLLSKIIMSSVVKLLIWTHWNQEYKNTAEWALDVQSLSNTVFVTVGQEIFIYPIMYVPLSKDETLVNIYATLAVLPKTSGLGIIILCYLRFISIIPKNTFH